MAFNPSSNIVNSLFNVYMFLSLILVIGGLALLGMDAKGFPLLILALVMAATLRLLWTIREELRVANKQQRVQAGVLHEMVSQRSETRE
ncbi:hypothetical protein DESA109040_02740 [Deinococcus saxicola]|uniref:hypothetical protein n=1 Tax=Deinococcus saxicola TaxID=249406 RepID=UPI0039F0411C